MQLDELLASQLLGGGYPLITDKRLMQKYRVVMDGALLRRVPAQPTDIAYLAGIIDGEGTISVYETRFTLRIANNHRPLLQWIAERFGGSVHISKRSRIGRDGYHRQPSYCWSMGVGEAAELLPLLQPHLIVKADRCAAALALLERRRR